MAGEWLKFECTLPEKRETLAITVAMGWDDPDLTVGKLMRLFRWFDQQTIDGNAHSVTPALLDRVIGVTGFTEAVAKSGWLTINDSGIALSNFERHNGATAKSRALTAKRVATHRSNAESNADTVTPPLAREEKRREEVNTTSLRSVVARPTKKPPDDFEITTGMRAWAFLKTPGLDIDFETEKFKDHTFAHARSDWKGAWRNWMHKAVADQTKRGQNGQSFETNHQRLVRERIEKVAPDLAEKRPGFPHSAQLLEIFDVAPKRLG
jgi:hypothetical protein